MRRLAAIFLTVILCVLDTVAQVDSARLAQLDTRMGEYFSLLEQEPGLTGSCGQAGDRLEDI